nr:hypothetical protein [Trueperaceae bacterium]
ADTTASAVLADVLDALDDRPGPRPLAHAAPVLPFGSDDDPLEVWG